MKKTIRIIAMLLVTLITLSTLASCDVIKNVIPGLGSDQTDQPDVPDVPSHKHVYVDGKCECGKTDSSYVPPHQHNYVDGKCECGAEDPNYEPPHEHSYVNGKCECGAEDPNYEPPHEHNYVDGKCECGAEDPDYGSPDLGDKSELYSYWPQITETMPAIYINTTDGSNEWATRYNRGDKLAGNIDYVDATISVNECDEDYEMTDVSAEVKVRGNYTLDYIKKPIRIKFSKKANMLGLNEGQKFKNWVLLADWKDLSMCNNSVAFYLGNTILGSDGYYCTDFRNVEVYLNGQYWGVYLLVEQQEVKDGRTSVPEVEDDYTGNDIGYYFEFDGYWNLEGSSYLDGGDGDPTFTMNHQGLRSGNNGYTVKSDLYAKSQLTFLQNYMNNVFYIAYQANYNNTYYKFNSDYTGIVLAPEITSAKEAVGNVIDLQALVDMYVLNEIAKDLDFDWSSIYLSLNMTAEGNKKVTFEGPWDFDSCFGMINKENCSATDDMYAANDENPWIQLVRNEDWFWEMVYEKWAELKEYGVLDNAIKLVQAEKETYKDYYIKNYERWSSRVSGGNSECVYILNTYKDINTAQGLAADYLIDWLTKRFAFLDSQWNRVTVDESLPEDSVCYVIEAEDAALSGFASSTPIRTNKDYASNNSYVGNICAGASISFTINVENETTAYIFAGISKRSFSSDFSNWFTVTVNGERITLPLRTVEAIASGEEEWHTFVSIKLAPITLKAGENVITFTAVQDTTNFDYLEIYSAEEIW